MASPSLAEALAGQPRVLAYLERSLAQDAARAGAAGVSHAYLFCGTAAVESAALAFATVLVHPADDGAYEALFDRIERNAHPDVAVLEPQSARQGYLLEQIHEVISDAALTPVEASRKVYILKNAESLGIQSANALLKTLEEPASDVVFILLAPSAGSVLPTIASRCSVVPFALADPSAADVLVRDGWDGESARAALAITSSVGAARAYLESEVRQENRSAICAFLASPEPPGDWDALSLAIEVVRRVQEERKEAARGEAEAIPEEFLTKTARQAIDAAKKRAEAAWEREALREAVRVVETLLRDALAELSGSAEPPFNADRRELVDALAARGEAAVLSGLRDCARASEHLHRATTPVLVLQVLFLSLKESLWRPSAR